jgi:hypothetical protein
MPVIFLALLLLGGLLLWLRKLMLKKRLSEGLGRPVSDRELTSINAWMQAAKKRDAAK